jgi:hypothetical protein
MYLNGLDKATVPILADETGATVPRDNPPTQNALCAGYDPTTEYWKYNETSSNPEFPVCMDKNVLAYVDFTASA